MKKICRACGLEYEDLTKRKVGRTCSKKCANELGVLARKQKGSYKRTKEQNRKMVASMQTLRADGGYKFTQQGIENIRAAAQKRGGDPLFGEKMKAYKEEHKILHWSQTPEGRKRLSEIHTGKVVPAEHLRRMADAALRSHNTHSRSKKGIRQDLGCFFRSTWEANYARYLNHLGLRWKYEPVQYNLGNNRTYTPDFILEDGTHVEIKGWLTAKGAEKIRLFQEQYPAVKFDFVDKKRYTVLRKQYQFELRDWE